MAHLLVDLEDALCSCLDPVVHTPPHGLRGRPFQDDLSPRITLDSSPDFIIRPHPQDTGGFIAAQVHLFHV
jgi:hypothetical protein